MTLFVHLICFCMCFLNICGVCLCENALHLCFYLVRYTVQQWSVELHVVGVCFVYTVFIRIMFAATESSKWTCLQGFFILLVDSQHLLWHFVYNVYIIINGGLDAVLMRRIESLQKKTERKRMAVQCSYVHIIVVYCVVFYENDDIE